VPDFFGPHDPEHVEPAKGVQRIETLGSVVVAHRMRRFTGECFSAKVGFYSDLPLFFKGLFLKRPFFKKCFCKK
jgi:hypothetical protein